MTRRDTTSVRAGSGLGLVVGIGACLSVAMLVAALQGFPQVRPVEFGADGTELVPPTPVAEESTQPLPDLDPSAENPLLALIAAILGILIAAVVAVLIVRLLIRVVRNLWGSRPLRRRGAAELDILPAQAPDGDGAVDAPILRQGIEGAIDAIDRGSVPGDAIVAAWVGLEQSAARAGQERGVAETPGEFTIRIIGRREAIAADARGLLRLYEGVRFGGHRASDADRSEARDRLLRIQEGWA